MPRRVAVLSCLLHACTTPTSDAAVGGGPLAGGAVVPADGPCLGIGGGPAVGSIRRMPRDGGAVTTIIDGLDHPTSLASTTVGSTSPMPDPSTVPPFGARVSTEATSPLSDPNPPYGITTACK